MKSTSSMTSEYIVLSSTGRADELSLDHFSSFFPFVIRSFSGNSLGVRMWGGTRGRTGGGDHEQQQDERRLGGSHLFCVFVSESYGTGVMNPCSCLWKASILIVISGRISGRAAEFRIYLFRLLSWIRLPLSGGWGVWKRVLSVELDSFLLYHRTREFID